MVALPGISLSICHFEMRCTFPSSTDELGSRVSNHCAPTCWKSEPHVLRAALQHSYNVALSRLQAQHRELHDSVQCTKQKIQASREQGRRLRLERHTLLQRCAAASNALHAPPVAPAPPSPHPTGIESPCACGGEAPTPQTPAVCSPDVDRPHSRMERPKETIQNCVQQLHRQIAQRSMHGRDHKPLSDSQRPMSSYKHHVSMSFADVSKHMTPQEFRSSSRFNFRELRNAVAEYQTDAASQLGSQVSDICWFLEWPYEKIQPPLSASMSIDTIEGHISGHLGHIAIFLECLFLVMEYEHLASAAMSSYASPEHPTLDESAPPPLAPNTLTRLCLRARTFPAGRANVCLWSKQCVPIIQPCSIASGCCCRIGSGLRYACNPCVSGRQSLMCCAIV